jgi:hypothetical protein
MEKQKWIRFVESFVILPVLTMSGAPVGAISQVVINIVNTPPIVSQQKINIETSSFLAPSLGALAINDALSQKLEAQKVKASSIDSFFKAHDMPLEGMGMKMVLEAEKNEIDWRLLPAIAVRESSGGINACNKVENNPFGWGSCKIGFKSIEEAIEIVALNLGGNNPNTAMHYDNKTTKQILRAYNPPSIVPKYAEQVIAIMNGIGAEDAAPLIPSNVTT